MSIVSRIWTEAVMDSGIVSRSSSVPCQGCQNVGNATIDPHPCPYAQDIHNDDTVTCNCCDECMYQCAMDI